MTENNKNTKNKAVVTALIVMIAAVVIASLVIGYFKLTTKLYNEAQETKRVLSVFADDYKQDGWYDKPVRTMYAPDGRTLCIYDTETDAYENVGWYTEPVTLMYAPENKTLYVKQSEIEAYKNVGWYTEPLIPMYNAAGEESYILSSDTAKYESDGWTYEPPTREGLEPLHGDIKDYLSSRSGDWGVFVKSMKSNEYLSINEKPYSSASLIKLFTMAAVYEKAAEGTLSLEDNQEQLELMVCESSNVACNYLTRKLGDGNTVAGFEFENHFTSVIGGENTQHKSELLDETTGHVIFTGRNLTSPKDCGTVLEQIYRGKLIDQESSSRMLDLLKRQQRTWKIPDSLPEGTVTANKTGENDKVEGDAAIVYSPACDYVICVIGNGSVGSGVGTIQEVSKMTYTYFNN